MNLKRGNKFQFNFNLDFCLSVTCDPEFKAINVIANSFSLASGFWNQAGRPSFKAFWVDSTLGLDKRIVHDSMLRVKYRRITFSHPIDLLLLLRLHSDHEYMSNGNMNINIG